MAKQIIVLGSISNQINTTINVVFWFPITSGQKAQVNGSAWTGASAAENTAIQNGSVLEETQTFQFPSPINTVTVKQVLNQSYTNRSAQISGVGPGQFGGVFFDSSTGWSA